MMELSILCDNDTVRGMYENHEHFHTGDSGLDLYFPENVELPGKSLGTLVSFGISVRVRCTDLMSHIICIQDHLSQRHR